MAKRARQKRIVEENLDATSERIKKAGNDTYLSKDGVRYVRDWPLSTLHSKGLLSKNKEMNDAMYIASDKLYRIWYLSGLSGYPSISLNGISGGDSDKSWGMPRSESSMMARKELRNAIDLLGKRTWLYVEDICISQISVEKSGMSRSTYRSRDKAIAVAMDRLREGLEIIAREWGYVR